MNLNKLKRRMQGVLFKMTMMITCREFEAFIIDYLDGDLLPEQSRKFELHLKI